VKIKSIKNKLDILFQLLRWDKPTGRLILLIPAGWSLYLTPGSPPNFYMLIKIVLGGLLVSGLGCVANDIWDREIDTKVLRTQNRPLAANKISLKLAFIITLLLIIGSFFLTLSLPEIGRVLSIKLAFCALPLILIYPLSKRWFKFPQLILSFCWGFAVLIPWAANEGNIQSLVLLFCWLATIFWTFGFDTVYALADKEYDLKIGINSSAITLKSKTKITIQLCYFLTTVFLSICACINKLNFYFWPFLIISGFLMQRDIKKLDPNKTQSISLIGTHFRNQSIYGSLILLGIIISS